MCVTEDDGAAEAGRRAANAEHYWSVAADGLVTIWPGLALTDWIAFGDVARVPAEVNVCGPYRNVLYRVRLLYDDRSRRMEVAEVEVRPRDPSRPLRSEDYRSLPIAAVRRKALAKSMLPFNEKGNIDGKALGSPRHRAMGKTFAKTLDRQDVSGRGGAREALSPEHLREVARLYRKFSGRRAFRADIGAQLAAYASDGLPALPNTVKNWIQAAGDRMDPDTGQPYLGPGEGKGRRRS